MGFPVVWTNLLAEQDVATSEYAFLLAVYLLIFLVDEIAILVGALAVMRIGRLRSATAASSSWVAGCSWASSPS